MRHGRKVNHLGRTSSHRKAMLSNLASSLIISKRITTTVAKAKELRKYVEPLITKAKSDTMHSRRTVFSYLQNKESVKELFGTVASRTTDRQGGYTRIIKMGDNRLGDNAEMCLIELVDFNEIYKKEGVAKKAKTRRSRTAKGKKAEASEPAAETAAEPAQEVKAEKPAKKAKAKSGSKKEDKE
ncbi:MAG: 50S ribosomal protein L17 [Cyclobacteriaceae bacterium]|nr:50S ribosomal protein L17 [Cyclobacteriaceae bacterium]